MNIKSTLCFCLVIQWLPSVQLHAQKSINRTFEGIKIVHLVPPKGNCQITKSVDGKVGVVLSTSYRDGQAPNYSIIQVGDSLKVMEESHPSSVQGMAPVWKLLVPDRTKIVFETGNGNIEVMDLETELQARTGKGNFTLTNVRGVFKLTTSNGDIHASNLSLTGSSMFKSAKGDCDISLHKSPSSDLEVSSGKGNVTVNFNHEKILGLLEVTTTRRSKAIAPFEFTESKDFEESGDDEPLTRKSVRIGDALNKTLLSTADGVITILK